MEFDATWIDDMFNINRQRACFLLLTDCQETSDSHQLINDRVGNVTFQFVSVMLHQTLTSIIALSVKKESSLVSTFHYLLLIKSD